MPIAAHLAPDWLDEDFLTPAFFQDPYALYVRLLDVAPVAWSAKAHAWLVCPYEQVTAGLADRRLSSGARIPTLARTLSEDGVGRNRNVIECLKLMMSFRDEPDHARLRRVVSRVFTPRGLSDFEPAIHDAVVSLIRQLPHDEEFDFVSRFAFPLPALVICSILGIPADRLDDVHRWADSVVTLLSSATMTDESADRAHAAIVEADQYIQEEVASRLHNPTVGLLSTLATAQSEGILSAEEVTAMVVLLLFAGFETTEGLISNALQVWMADDALLGPSSSLVAIEAFIEEVLRFDPPVHRQSRIAMADLRISNVDIAAGETILFMIGASGRDPAKFIMPNAFIPDRQDAANVGFGHGPHFCLGAPLARLEARIAFEHLSRLPAKVRATGPAAYGTLLAVRKPSKLPVAIGGST